MNIFPMLVTIGYYFYKFLIIWNKKFMKKPK